MYRDSLVAESQVALKSLKKAEIEKMGKSYGQTGINCKQI